MGGAYGTVQMQHHLTIVQAIKKTQGVAPVSLASIHPVSLGINTHKQMGATPFN